MSRYRETVQFSGRTKSSTRQQDIVLIPLVEAVVPKEQGLCSFNFLLYIQTEDSYNKIGGSIQLIIIT